MSHAGSQHPSVPLTPEPLPTNRSMGNGTLPSGRTELRLPELVTDEY